MDLAQMVLEITKPEHGHTGNDAKTERGGVSIYRFFMEKLNAAEICNFGYEQLNV